MRRPLAGAVLSLGLIAFLNASAAGSEPGCCSDHTHHRAGYPQKVSCCAWPSDTKHYVGYYVGGGCPCFGRPPCATEGTWGWDYQGCLARKVILNWCHKYQGGVGAYRTVGENKESLSTP
jgi:hypothetical protein